MPAREAAGGAVPQRDWPTRSSSSTRAAANCSRMFGVLPFKPFDYVVIPRCTTYELDFDAGERSPICW